MGAPRHHPGRSPVRSTKVGASCWNSDARQDTRSATPYALFAPLLCATLDRPRAPMPVKILHAADLHLDSPLRNLPDAAPSAGPAVPLRTLARSATRRAFENLSDLAVAQKVEVLLLAGDIFDGKWEDHHTGLFFSRELGRFTATGV